MLSLGLFVLALIAAFIHSISHKDQRKELLLRYILLFNTGLMGLLAAYGHVFMGPEIARDIGWAPGSPFQFEIGMANLAFGVLGILAFWASRPFQEATVIGWCVLLLGCFVGHLINYFTTGNTAPFNIGVFLWVNDLAVPLIALWLLLQTRRVPG